MHTLSIAGLLPGFLILLTALITTPAHSAPLPSLLPQQPVIKAPETSKNTNAVKVGYVDIAKILGESSYGSAFQSKVKEKQAKLQAQIESKRKQLDKLKSSTEAKLATMTQQQREAKAKEFQKKVDEFQKFGRNAEDELLKFQEEQQRTFYEALEKACADHGKSGGFSMIVIKKDMLYLGSGVEALDVTEAIAKLLDATVPQKK